MHKESIYYFSCLNLDVNSSAHSNLGQIINLMAGGAQGSYIPGKNDCDVETRRLLQKSEEYVIFCMVAFSFLHSLANFRCKVLVTNKYSYLLFISPCSHLSQANVLKNAAFLCPPVLILS